jgi:hypothetical protein
MTVLAFVCVAMGAGGARAQPILPDFAAATFMPGAPIDNPWRPWIPGTLYTYEGEIEDDGETILETVKVLVTFDTKEILGIPCTVVRDTVFEDDVLIEDTFDWYAQDTDGNVWYMGEFSTEYEYDDEGNVIGVDHGGSWEAGVDGAQPGFLMEANPLVGDHYYQEYYVSEAEDEAEVLSVDELVSIALGDFDPVLQTLETTALEPDVQEFKYYALGLGNILVEELDDEGEVEFASELVGVEFVPEPASLSLLLIGVAALARRRR